MIVRSLWRLAIRNIARRPGEAALVVLGSLLGTAIITAAFIIGDTFEQSIIDVGRRQLGPIDERIESDSLVQGREIALALEGLDSPLIDGLLANVTTGAAIATTDSAERRAEPFAFVSEVDLVAARAFGGGGASTGLESAPDVLPADGVLIGRRLADTLAVDPGDEVDVFAFGTVRRLRVVDVMPNVGLGGYSDAYLPPGTILEMFEGDATPAAARPPKASMLVSNLGGVYDGAIHTEAVVATIEGHLGAFGDVEVEPIKQDLIASAKAEGDSIGQVFLGVGSFSVVVGILLLVNLFVMLAEERKRELGVMRAIGMKRSHLQGAFALEGALYAIAAALAGAGVGIGVGWVIAQVTQSIIASDDPQFQIVFHVEPASLVTGSLLGLTIALTTVVATSVRIARLNVIRAIRDLPEPTADRLTTRAKIASLLGVASGIAIASLGSAAAVLVGPAVALFSAIPLLRRPLGTQWSVALPAAATLVWSASIFSLAPEATDNAGIGVFVIQGIVLVGSGVLLLSTAERLWHGLSDRLMQSGKGLSLRLALAYPLARKVRTGILLSMFGLIIFTMTFLATIAEIFGAQAATFADKDRGGFDLFVDSNSANPVSAQSLAAVDGVAQVASFLRSFPEFTTHFEPDGQRWSATGFDQDLVDGGVPSLSKRLDGFASDQAVFEAILADPSLTIVPDYFLQTEAGPPDAHIELGDSVTMRNPRTDETLVLTVAGVTDADFVFNGALVSASTLRNFLGSEAFAGRHYVAVSKGVDATDLAVRLDGALLANGVQAEVFLDAVEEQIAEQNGFFTLLQGYLGLGLLIGVAGLGVVMVRAVRERRRQVGILRAMGFGVRVIRRAFLLEAATIAVQGIALGVGLGLLTAYQVLTNSSAFGDVSLPFVVPWAALSVIVVVPLGASLVATLTPARRAAAIAPAAALRFAD